MEPELQDESLLYYLEKDLEDLKSGNEMLLKSLC